MQMQLCRSLESDSGDLVTTLESIVGPSKLVEREERVGNVL